MKRIESCFLNWFNTPLILLRMPFTRNHFHRTGSEKHLLHNYMTCALWALVFNCMNFSSAKPNSVKIISCKRHIAGKFSMKNTSALLMQFTHQHVTYNKCSS